MPHDYRGQSIILKNADGEILLQFRDGNPRLNPLNWDFFGGGYDHGEELLPGARRELLEELGVDVALDDLQVKGEYTDDLVHEAIILCLRPIEWREIDLREGAGCGFFTKEEAMQLPLIERVRSNIEKFC